MTEIEKVKSRLLKLGQDPKKSLGQNFLVSELVIQGILKKVKSFEPKKVIEVGPGLGALTDHLLSYPDLTLIELDSEFAKYWREQGATVVEADALNINWSDIVGATETCFVSNLPYQISSRIVIERSLGPTEVTEMVLMFQREVAQRIVASPKTSDYGLLSVIAQFVWDIGKVVDAPPSAFFPPPKVTSRVLYFKRKNSVHLEAAFLKFLRLAFKQKRKMLKNNLQQGFVKEHLVEAFEYLDLKMTSRAEELEVEQHWELYQHLNSLKKKLKDEKP